MPQTSRRQKLRKVVAGAAALTVLGGVAATNVGSAPGSLSHTSSWSHAEWSIPKRNTTVEMNIGYDDPQDAVAVRVGEIRVTQSWCDRRSQTKQLVQRTIGARIPTPFALNNPRANNAFMLNLGPLVGTETRTPAGTGSDCGEPTGAPVVKTTSVTAIASFSMTAKSGSTPLQWGSNDEDSTATAFYYRDAAANGQLTLLENDGSYPLPASRSGGSWFWEGFWQDATDQDIVPGS
jgi:hypothetical protein